MLVVNIAYLPAAYTVVDGAIFERKALSETSLYRLRIKPQVLQYRCI